MNRRTDLKTAEKIRMTLLTKAAFERAAAEQYARIAGVPEELIADILDRAGRQIRQYDHLSHSDHEADRRAYPRG